MSWLILVIIFVFLMIGYIYTEFLYRDSAKDTPLKEVFLSKITKFIRTDVEWFEKNGDNLFNTKVDLKKEDSKSYYFTAVVRNIMMLVFFFKKNTLVTRFTITAFFVELYSNMVDLPKHISALRTKIDHKLLALSTWGPIEEAKIENPDYSLEVAKYSKEVVTPYIISLNISSLVYGIRKFVVFGVGPNTNLSRNLLDKTNNLSTSKSVINIMNAEKLNRNEWFSVDQVTSIVQHNATYGKNIKNNIYIKEKGIQDRWLKGYYTKAIYYTNNFTSSYTKLTI